MGVISNREKRSKLGWCYRADTAHDLLAALEAQVDTKAAGTNTGLQPSSIAANNHSASYSNPSNVGGITPRELELMWQGLLELFDERKSMLGGSPSDAAVYTEMLFALASPARVRNDYTAMRV